MTLSRQRHLRVPALLALLLIGVWVGIGLVHEHTGAPTCQVCNALQFNAADLVAPITVGAPDAISVLADPVALPNAAAPYLATPPGRAPPLA
ncbi:MAG TPA: hypothetical protein VFU59_08465 [Candidatus Eisenbacteria bacterium]|nr:hypothetical protein [Candidatus Eisenbacteria bacterium]